MSQDCNTCVCIYVHKERAPTFIPRLFFRAAVCDTALMAENKTQATGASVDEFLAAVEHPVRREDGFRLQALMSEITGQQA
jgi:hypothetical protein